MATARRQVRWRSSSRCCASRRRSESSSSESHAGRQVWIVGHSIVLWASRYAATSGWGESLGLQPRVTVHWVGIRGTRWASLLQQLRQTREHRGTPHAVIIQLGENNLPEMKRIQLLHDILSSLAALPLLLPGTVIFWSQLLERRVWRGARVPGRVNTARKKICRAVSWFVLAAGGRSIAHPAISFREMAIYLNEGWTCLNEGWTCGCAQYRERCRTGWVARKRLAGAGGRPPCSCGCGAWVMIWKCRWQQEATALPNRQMGITSCQERPPGRALQRSEVQIFPIQ
ncbi:uncharacterized protein LOC125437778 [Sphaerodactylus townsendi]|uniref:uncharacterized protein LOC125437778 n=1 Tax=Sphaerodactylus townsendi TaxID=933632 RepID=UPI0020260C18|nr:uncharacterized protein LOC125437778 [Sphaerodactylus townsendi]